MIEKQSKKIFQTAVMSGAVVYLQLEQEENMVLTGVLADWSGKSCQVSITSKGELPALSDGMYLQLINTRMDGVFCVPGQIKNVDISDFPRAYRGELDTASKPFYSCLVTIEIDFKDAQRIQNRSFFRVSGAWDAHIAYPFAEREEENIYHHAIVRNLSANGILLEDSHGLLHRGCRFRILMELEDGKPPMSLEALVLRQDENRLSLVPVWGCSFVRAEDDNEVRIVRILNERIRSRSLIQTGV